MEKDSNLKIFLAAVLPGILTIFIIFFLVMPKVQEGREEAEQKQINSFVECVEAGNLVMESYPRQCRAGDQVFTEEIEIDSN